MSYLSFADRLTIPQDFNIEEGTDPPQLEYNPCKISRDRWRKHPADAIVFDYIKITGVTYCNPDGVSRQKILSKLFEDEIVELVRERNNKYDKNAVAVVVAMGQVGYIPEEIAPEIVKILDMKIDYIARLFTPYRGGRDKIYGASLDIRFTPPKVKTLMAKVVDIKGESKINVATSLGDEEEIFVNIEDVVDEKVAVSSLLGELGRLGKKDSSKILSLVEGCYEYDARVYKREHSSVQIEIQFWK